MESTGIGPGFTLILSEYWCVYQHTHSSIAKVNDISLLLDSVGGIFDVQDWMFIEGVIFDKYSFTVILAREQMITEVGKQ